MDTAPPAVCIVTLHMNWQWNAPKSILWPRLTILSPISFTLLLLYIQTIEFPVCVQLKCCGVHNYTSWIGTPWYTSHNNTVPLSCCKNTTGCTGRLDQLDLLNQQVPHHAVCFALITAIEPLKGTILPWWAFFFLVGLWDRAGSALSGCTGLCPVGHFGLCYH